MSDFGFVADDGEDQIKADVAKKVAAQKILAEGAANVPDDMENRRPKNASDLRAMMNAAATGATNTVMRGYLPEVSAGIAKLIGGKNIDYVKARDQTARSIDQDAAAAPLSYHLGGFGAAMVDPTNKILPGNGVVSSGLRAGVEGLLYNPGNEAGKIDPAQLDKRLISASFATPFGAASHGLSDLVGASARAYRAKQEMLNPGFEQSLRGEIDSGIDAMRNNYVKQRADQAAAGLKGKKVDFDPELLRGTDYVDETGWKTSDMRDLRKKLEKRVNKQTGAVRMDADKADQLRQELDQRAKYSQKGAVGAPKVGARGARQKTAADNLRSSRRAVAPELEPTFDEMSYAQGLMDEFGDKGSSPMALITNKTGTDMGSKIIDFDKMAGTNFRGRGADLRRGRFLIDGGPNIIPESFRQPVKAAANIGAAASIPIERLRGIGISDAILKQLLDAAMQSPAAEEQK